LSSGRYVVQSFFFSSRRRHTRSKRDWSSDVCSSDLIPWYRRLMLMSGLLVSTVSSEKIEPEEIEWLKEGDILEATFSEFAEGSRSEERRVGKECGCRRGG